MKYLAYTLVLIHAILLIWSLGGFLEMLLPVVPWKRFTNPDFPAWVLILHWSAILFAAVSFLGGYISRWPLTPQIMTITYIAMAIVCIIETFWYMTSSTKYIAMIAEFSAYTFILILVYRSAYFASYFNLD